MSYSRKLAACLASIGIMLFLVVSCLIVGGERVYASPLSDITSDSIEAKKDEIANAKAEQANIKSSITDMEKVVASLEAQRKNLDKYIASIDAEMGDIEGRIDECETLIAIKESEISTKEGELAEAQQQESAQYESMSERIQYLYECGESNYLDSLLQAESFADMLNRAEYVEELAAYDNRMLHQYIMQREYIDLCKQSLEQERANLNASVEALDAEKANLESVRQMKAKDLAAYEHDITLTEARILELEADLKFQTEIISGLEKEITDEQREILKASGITLGYDGQGFTWPAPSYTAVTSEFGWRSDPFTGKKAYHNGVDLASAKGTPIVAAYSGIVIEAGYNSSMGNYIFIDHGDNLRTIYMHASELYVEKNTVVIEGETIAAVGSTGRSTGPHLHFSVRLNGNYVSPWDYISK